ncbi:hypothetical protein BGX29_004607 [Mortierella sp. GBA35]|nr:hypothetical protein BGX29_004607 [Mortierella sp. GBA35]
MSSNQKPGKKVNIAQGGMRSEAKKTKVVFKNVLDTPFNIQWPEVTADNNAIVLDTVCDMVKQIFEYHNTRPKQHAKPDKKAKRAPSEVAGSAPSKPTTALATLDDSSSTTAESTDPASSTSQSPPPPAILRSIILGINAVTKALERSIQDLGAHPPPTAIILCKGDLVPSHLYTHLGPMIAMLPGVLLFPLLKGSERRLSEALGLPAVGALAIQSTEGSREAEDLVMILKGMVEPMTASWLPKIIPKSAARDKTSSKPTATMPANADSSGTTTATASVSTPAAPVAGSTSESSSATTSATTSATKAAFIPTNIKVIKTTMPIVVKTPKPANPNAANNSSDYNKGKGQQPQQKQHQQQKQQQSQNPKQVQKSNQGKNKKPPVDNLDSNRGQGKKAKGN